MSNILNFFLIFSLVVLVSIKAIQADELKKIECNDLGVHGAVFEIEEESLLDVMMKRLGDLKESGKLEILQEKMVNDAKKRALEPKRLEHITKTTRHRVFNYDPTLVVGSDIKIDQSIQGKEVVLAKKGDRINPLDTVQLTRGLLFIDGEDPDQLKLIDSYSRNFDIVLVAGKPIDLKDKLGLIIYFDQGGALTKRFGINHVPAKVEQAHKDERVLQITEFVP